MANSFFIGTETRLLNGSRVFAEKVIATPEAYGISPSLAADYAALDAQFAACYQAARAPQTRSRVTVIEKNDVKKRLRKMASDLAKIINGTSHVTDAQKLELALNVRKQRSPKPPPGVPGEFRVQLRGDGALKLRWKCNNPTGAGGTMYQIWRRVDATAKFTYFGGTGQKEWIDNTVPAGASQVIYRVKAFRSTSASEAAEFIVHFGSADPQATTSTMTQDADMRITA